MCSASSATASGRHGDEARFGCAFRNKRSPSRRWRDRAAPTAKAALGTRDRAPAMRLHSSGPSPSHLSHAADINLHEEERLRMFGRSGGHRPAPDLGRGVIVADLNRPLPRAPRVVGVTCSIPVAPTIWHCAAIPRSRTWRRIGATCRRRRARYSRARPCCRQFTVMLV
jgi:hypothetical protein